MPMGSNHDHDHSRMPAAPTKALGIAFAITAVVFFGELAGGLISGSLALLSDAMHMLSDSAGLIIALVASIVGKRAASGRATYGHRRIEVMAALINAVTVTGVVVWILVQAIGRVGGDHSIDTNVMLGVAVVGLVANAASAWVLSRAAGDSLNVRGALLHVMADMLGSVAVIVAAVVIKMTGWLAADTVASLIIVALVLPRSLQLLWQSAEVLLERAPRGVDTQEIQESLEAVPGVLAVHDLHVWSTDGVTPLATCHIVVDGDNDISCGVLDRAQAKLREFGIEHSTIQLETPDHQSHEHTC
ncbi:cation transporter [Corynebacterium testudinoris]|nr:cation transporter [Corynebacterium testudinoris]